MSSDQESQPADQPAISVTAEYPIPDLLNWAFDVRWQDAQNVILAAGQKGVFTVSSDSRTKALSRIVAGRGEPGGWWLSSHLGVSPDLLVVSSAGLSYAWAPKASLELREGDFQSDALDSIVDVDLLGKDLLILGGWRGDQGAYAPDGSIAWLLELGGESTVRRPVFYSRSGPGTPSMGACGGLALGAARFMRDGAFVLVPGVEDGVFWYDAEGQLLRTWESREFGLRDECAAAQRTKERIRADPVARNRWHNQRILVDEVLPLTTGFGLVLRSVEDGVASWRLARAHRDGRIDWFDLPFTGGSWSYLKGDVRDHRAVFLIVEHSASLDPPATRPRLIFADLHLPELEVERKAQPAARPTFESEPASN
ncbi:MAG: hypothetical protein AAF481_05355 [Acidobacteriota bacterium]